jgi:beta-glucosidase
MIFLTFPESVKDYPVRVFKGFDKVMLQPGESKEVTIFIDNHDLSYFDVDVMDYVKPEDGEYIIYAGSNAKDLPLKVSVLANGDDYSDCEEVETEIAGDDDLDSADEVEVDADVDEEEDSADEDSADEEALRKRAYKLY